jgi:alkylation response protein AidB-like acyl-CoA dehydrogenase
VVLYRKPENYYLNSVRLLILFTYPGVWPSGTSIISFDNVMVPVSNLIGKENEGFKYIMTNFNHERWSICVQATRFARVCLEEAMIHAQRRETFGKKLIEHPVIRNKLAHMARHVEATQAMLESVAFQLTRMSKAEATNRLAGPIALLKAQSTTTFELCAREASQVHLEKYFFGCLVDHLSIYIFRFLVDCHTREVDLERRLKDCIEKFARMVRFLIQSVLSTNKFSHE